MKQIHNKNGNRDTSEPKFSNAMYISTEQNIELNIVNVFNLVTAIYAKAEVKLAMKIQLPDYVHAAKPNFFEQLKSTLIPAFNSFAEEKNLWANAIQQYNPNKHNELIAICQTLCTKFHTVDQTVESTEQLLRNLYVQHSVFIPIILINKTEFRLANLERLVADYSGQFQKQSKFFADSELMIHKLKAEFPFRTFFSFNKAYRQTYSDALEAAKSNMDSKKERWCTDIYRHICYEFLKIFVKELNEYGRVTFKAIQKYSSAGLEEAEVLEAVS